MEILLVLGLLFALPSSADLLDPQDFTSLGVFDTSAGGSFTIDTDALTITDDAAPGTPLYTGVIDDQNGLADSYGPGGAVTTVGPAGIPHIAVFTFSDLQLIAGSTFTIEGHRALALLSQGDALIDVELHLNGDPGALVFISPFVEGVSPVLRGGPGGFDGAGSLGVGVLPENGRGPSGGGSSLQTSTAVSNRQLWGASGSHGHLGPDGLCLTSGCAIAPPIVGLANPATTDPAEIVLRGGSGGGAAQLKVLLATPVEETATGAGGGGAIELGAVGVLTLGPASVVDASAAPPGINEGTYTNEFRATSGINVRVRGGYGAGGGVRLHAGRLVNQGTNNISSRGAHADTIYSNLINHNLNEPAGGVILLRGLDSELIVGQTSISPGQFGALPGNGVFSVDIPNARVLSGQSVVLASQSVLQVQTATAPRVEVALENVEILDDAIGVVAAAGFTNAFELRLSGANAQLTGTGVLTNAATLRGTGSIASAVVNTATGSIVVVTEALSFGDNLTNQIGGQVSVVAGSLSLPGDGVSNDDGLVNLGDLNLVNATVNGDVRSPAGSNINVAGNVVFNGFVSGAGSFSGTQNLVVFNGGYSPGDSPAQIGFGGDLVFGPIGKLTLEFAGVLPGIEHDRLDVTGDLGLAGTLDLLPIGGYTPPLGSSFTLLTYANRFGEFESVGGVQQSGDLDLAINYVAGALVMATVRRGDVNGDGALTAADTAIVQAGAAGGLITTAYGSGDVDGSGVIDGADVSIVEMAVAAAGGTAVPVVGAAGTLLLIFSLVIVASLARPHTFA